MARDSLETRLGARCLDALAAHGLSADDLDLTWSNASVELFPDELPPDVAAALLESPLVASTGELCWGTLQEAAFVAGGQPSRSAGVRHVAPVLARGAALHSLAVAGAQVSLAGATHPRLWQLQIAAPRWPELAGAHFPNLERLQLVVDEPLPLAELARVLTEVTPKLRELWLGGRAVAQQRAELVAFEPFTRLERLRLEDSRLDVPAAKALLMMPGVLARVPHVELGGGTWEATPWIIALERKQYGLGLRWSAITEGCFARPDPATRVWWWLSGDEGRASGMIAWLPHRPPVSELERDLLAAIARDEPGSEVVYQDWREVAGVGREPPTPRSVEEAAYLLSAARESLSPWTSRFTEQDLADLLARSATPDCVPIERGTFAALEAEQFDAKVRWLLALMRDAPELKLVENGVEQPGARAFEPPIGRARRAVVLRDRWNDMAYVAETTDGFALMQWATGA